MIEIIRKFNGQIKFQGSLLAICLSSGAYVAFFETQQYDVGFTIIFVFFLYFLVNIWPDLGYRIAWDEDTISMRDRGFKKWPLVRHDWNSIKIDDIDQIVDGFDDQGFGKAAFVPFEVLDVYSRNPDDKMIWIHPESLNNYGVRIMLQHIHNRRPDLLSDNVIDNFLNSEIKL